MRRRRRGSAARAPLEVVRRLFSLDVNKYGNLLHLRTIAGNTERKCADASKNTASSTNIEPLRIKRALKEYKRDEPQHYRGNLRQTRVSHFVEWWERRRCENRANASCAG